jgi:UDP-N-acetylmuramyl pentapeptide phosphotransferase/UDP-N-acetylglucosamine-1-phosphate transferase
MSLLLSLASNPFALAFGVSALVAIAIVATGRFHGKYSFDLAVGVQKVHTHPVARIGGLAMAVSALSVIPLLSEQVRSVFVPTLILGLIAFSFGLMEDLSKKVPIAFRLWATMIPGVVGYLLAGMTLSYIGIDWLDSVLQWTPVAILFTAFAVCGVTPSMNMIDGLNGLAGWTAIWIFSGIGLLALSSGDVAIAISAGVLVASTAGFLLLNWPFGKLFLGDGGAYFLGVTIAWLCVSLVNRNPEISPFACLVLCSYPIIEVLYSMTRRTKAGTSSGNPDRLHLHQLLTESLINPYLNTLQPVYKNSIAGICISVFSIPAALMALAFAQEQWTLIAIFAALVLAYLVLYQIACMRSKALQTTPPITEQGNVAKVVPLRNRKVG